MTLKNYTFLQLCQMLIVPAFFATLKMLLISGILSTIFGFIFGVILVVTEKGVTQDCRSGNTHLFCDIRLCQIQFQTALFYSVKEC